MFATGQHPEDVLIQAKGFNEVIIDGDEKGKRKRVI